MGAAIGHFTSLGYTVCIPLTDSQDYDLVVDIEGTLNRVQVKTCRKAIAPNKGYQICLKVCGGNRGGTGVVKQFDPTRVDTLFVLTGDGGRYVIPSHSVKGTYCIVVGNAAYQEFKVMHAWPSGEGNCL